MKRILLLTLILLFAPLSMVKAQTEIWSHDLEGLGGWLFEDLDGDGTSFGTYTDGTYVGFLPGSYLGSLSLALTPDNLVMTPVFGIPGIADNITLSLKVASSSDTDYQETFGIYIQENGVGSPIDNLLHQETLTTGGPNSYHTINVAIPNSYAGKSVKLVVRHFNTNNEFFFMIDDFMVEYQDVLSINESLFDNFSFYPNPTKNRINFNSNSPITKVQIFNVLGQNVLSFNTSNIVNKSIDLTSINQGNYLMKVSIDNTSQTYRLIKN